LWSDSKLQKIQKIVIQKIARDCNKQPSAALICD